MPDSRSRGGGWANPWCVLAVLIFLTLSNFVRAMEPGDCTGYYQTVHGRIDFPRVEWIAKNHEIGLFRGSAVALRPWIQVADGAYLGLDQSDRLVQVLELGDRTVAYLMSGEEAVLRDVFLSKRGQLAAVDQVGRLFIFDWAKWRHVDARSLVRRTALTGAAGLCGLTMLNLATAQALGVSLASEIMLVQAAGLSGALAMVHGFFTLQRFEEQNQNTNGLIPLADTVPGFKSSRLIFDDRGRVADYSLRGHSGTVRLSQILDSIQTAPQEFGITCEHKLLARGIPPEHYEP